MAAPETEGRSIVRTEGVLGGKPRIDGTRIGVHHVVPYVLEDKYTVSEVAYLIYDHLSEGDVLAALAYYFEHREEIEAIRQREREVIEEHRSEALLGPEDVPQSE
jgi:uncharacterized protein (DUF433 family)